MIQISKKRKWFLTGMATLGVMIISVGVGGSAGADAPAAPPNGPASGLVAPADLVSGGHETSYASVAPCRIVDTRLSSAGNLVNGVARTFAVGGTAGFANQGGQNGGCNIPTNATAVTASISGTLSNGSGYLRAWAYGTGEPLSIALLLTKGVSEFTGTTIPMNSVGMTVKAIGSNTRFVADVTGYFIPKIYAIVNPTGTVRNSSRILAVTHVGTGSYRLTADASITSCAIGTNAFSTYQAAAYASGTSIYVTTSTAAGVPTDVYFQLSVTC